MRPEDFDYSLPIGLIAQRPLPQRTDSRLLLIDRNNSQAEGSWQDRAFADLPELLRGDELLIVNDARVIPARLHGFRIRGFPGTKRVGNAREQSDRVEILLSRQLEPDTWEALVRPGRKMPVGQQAEFGEGEIAAEVLTCGERGFRTLKFMTRDDRPVAEHLERLGHVPLPPYINRPDEESDRDRYQTVFAKMPGAIAAPTAGLHFTTEILGAIRARGVEIRELTLDVGLGTFQPMRSGSLEAHKIHRERYEIPEATAQAVARAREEGRRIVAIGTTVVRALEDAALRAAGSSGVVAAGNASTNLFIFPGFEFRVVDALLTNFHLPRSTLLALVCAFAGQGNTLKAYRHAVAAGYRFYSYGDCMFIR